LDQHLEPELPCACGKRLDELERLRQHEAARALGLDRIPDSVETDARDAARRKGLENMLEIRAPLRMAHVDVDLLLGERRPQQAASAVRESDRREGEGGPRPVYRKQIVRRGALWKDAVVGQE